MSSDEVLELSFDEPCEPSGKWDPWKDVPLPASVSADARKKIKIVNVGCEGDEEHSINLDYDLPAEPSGEHDPWKD